MKKLMVCLLALCMVIAMFGCKKDDGKVIVNGSDGETAAPTVPTVTLPEGATGFVSDAGYGVTVEFDNTDGYEMTGEMPYTIFSGDRMIGSVSFAENGAFDLYSEAVSEDEASTVLDSGEKDGNKYMFWNDDMGYNYVIQIGDSDMTIIFYSLGSEDAARNCFDRMTFSMIES